MALFPSTWLVGFHDVAIAAEATPGVAWDAGGGLPDPYVVVQLDGIDVCTTPVDSETLAPRWTERCLLELDEASEVSVLLVDEDGPSDDIIAAWWMGQPFCTSCLHERSARLDGDPHVADFVLELELELP